MSPLRLALVVGPLVALLADAGAAAQSSLVAELNVVAMRYHEDPSSLDRMRQALEQAVTTDPDVGTLVALARVSFIWGDIRARSDAEKLAAYDRGRQVAQRAVEVSPKSAPARFWHAANTARWGQTKGILRSLALLPTIQREIRLILDLDPTFTAAYALAGNVFYEVPGLLGGDLKKAEEMFRKGLQQDPRFTGMRVGLAKTLAKSGRVAEARRELVAVLEEKAPANPADWTLKDAREARALLDSLKGR
jgi:tetratricopeptide (TPR) repeat protein